MCRSAGRAAAALALITLAACGTDHVGQDAVAAPEVGPAPVSSAAPVPKPAPARLPQGGTTIFPTYRVVAYYGTAGTGALGVLGEAGPDTMLPKWSAL